MNVKRILSIGAALMLSAASITACSTTPDQQAAAEKAYDKICTAQTPLFTAFMVAAEAPGSAIKSSLVAKVQKINTSITTLCATRPTDYIAGLVTLSAIYAQFVSSTARAGSS